MMRRKSKGQSSRFGVMQISLLMLEFSALGWLVSRYMMEGREGWGDAALNTQFYALKLHGAGAMLFLFAIGMKSGEWLPWFRQSKAKMALVLLPLAVIVSGWLIYYGPTGPEHDFISMSHWILGLLALATLLAWKLMFSKAAGRKR